MKSSEKQTLKAFSIALSQQVEPLPDWTVKIFHQIAQSLETRVNQLEKLARTISPLSCP